MHGSFRKSSEFLKKRINTSQDMDVFYRFIIMSCDLNDILVNLPEITSIIDGINYYFFVEDITINNATIVPHSNDTISNNSNYVFTGERMITLIADYSTNNWIIQE